MFYINRIFIRNTLPLPFNYIGFSRFSTRKNANFSFIFRNVINFERLHSEHVNVKKNYTIQILQGRHLRMFCSNSKNSQPKVESSQGFGSSDLNQLDLTIQILNRIDENSTRNEKIIVVNNFMQKIGDLFLVCFQHNLPHLYKNISSINKKPIEAHREDICNFYLNKVENVLEGSFEGDEWIGACIDRTNIEAFNKMFESIVDPLDTEDIDDLMNQKKEIIMSKDKPLNIPQSHWWWFF